MHRRDQNPPLIPDCRSQTVWSGDRPQTANNHSVTRDNLLTESVLEKLDDTFGTPRDIQIETDVSEIISHALKETTRNPNDTLSSTFSPSQFDDTYNASQTISLDNSITELKRTVQSTNNDKDKTRTKTGKQASQDTRRSCNSDGDEILCIESCSRDVSTECIRCNLCFTWYHTNCVGIKDLHGVEAWVCAGCRALPKTVKLLKGQCETILQATEKNVYKS